jgi:glycine/D-amino acid oxidase-like deaminating enzyme
MVAALPSAAEVVIISGGVTGTSIAFHLAEAGVSGIAPCSTRPPAGPCQQRGGCEGQGWPGPLGSGGQLSGLHQSGS